MKIVMWIVAVVVLVIAGVAVYVIVNSGNLIKAAVETLGPEYLGVAVTLDSAELSLTDGAGELRGLVIGNPSGFDGPHAFSLGRIRLAVDPGQISQELVVIREIDIDAADLALVAQGSKTNLQKIMSNLESDSGAAEESSSAGEGPKLIIDRFAFTNARTSLDSDVLGASSVDIPDINLTDIGRKSQGVTIREALKQLLQPIVRASTTALARESLNVDELKQKAEERLDEEVRKNLGTGLDDLKKRIN